MTFRDEADDPAAVPPPPDGLPTDDSSLDPPPPEYDTRPDPCLLTPFARRQELFGRFLDDAELMDRQLAIAAAVRARRTDELRQLSETIATEEEAEDAAKPSELRVNRHHESGWSIRNRAAAELASEIAMAFLLSTSAARTLLTESSTLVADLPLTLEALETGTIRYEHARLIASTAWTLPTETRGVFEEEVLPWAKTLILSAFRAKLLTLREKHYTETMRERHEKAAAFRTVTLEPGEDGVGYLTIRDSIDTLTAIHTRITDIALAKTKDDPRTLAQRRTDVATEILLKGDLCAVTDGTQATEDGTTADGRRLGHGITAHVHITVPVLTLLGHDEEPATLNGTTPIDPATARRLVANAPGFYRVLTDPITGSIVSFDDTFRYFPKSLRRAVNLIDGTCTSPWCNTPAQHSDGHHPEPWATSHTTSLENSALLCPKDHTLIHNTRWSMIKLKNGDKQWISPCGRIRRVAPYRRLSPAFVEAMKPDPDKADTTTSTPQDSWLDSADSNEEMPF